MGRAREIPEYEILLGNFEYAWYDFSRAITEYSARLREGKVDKELKEKCLLELDVLREYFLCLGFKDVSPLDRLVPSELFLED